ncbi:MAG: MobP2 family relaxase [Leuconostoc lactis]|uniref:MobP2 family relaxase n=1 Tax=Leuconostoc lactis TaxID=1246 RepID=UPI0039924ACA
MVKTGKKAAFKLNEKQTAMVNLPAQFVTAKSANQKGQKYSSLVDYANDKTKTNEENNEAISEVKTLADEFKQTGYANRTNAVTEDHPIFGPNKLNYNNHDISVLRKQLDMAQENGNNIHELAFSIRGDWLVKNNLFDPERGIIDQNRLKHAEQTVAKTLINQGFQLPLGESEKDVVWFGVIHQDTDHLNMHLWFAKISPETRSEMIKQEGPYQGEPKGTMPLAVIERAKREFRNELMSVSEKKKRTDILKGLGHLKTDLIDSAHNTMLRDKYNKDLENIYDALPKNLRGRWQVGNSSLEATNTQMSKANHLTNQLLDKIFKNELHGEYQEFQKLAQDFDKINIEDQGVLRKGQPLFSEKRDADLRKRLANGLYRQFNEAKIIDVSSLEEMLDRVKQHHKLMDSDVAGLKRNEVKRPDNKNPSITSTTDYQEIPRFETISRSFTKISKVFQMDVRSEVNAERKFLRNQEREQQLEAEKSYGHSI